MASLFGLAAIGGTAASAAAAAGTAGVAGVAAGATTAATVASIASTAASIGGLTLAGLSANAAAKSQQSNLPAAPGLGDADVDEERRKQLARRSGGGFQSTITNGASGVQGPILGSAGSLGGGRGL